MCTIPLPEIALCMTVKLTKHGFPEHYIDNSTKEPCHFVSVKITAFIRFIQYLHRFTRHTGARHNGPHHIVA